MRKVYWIFMFFLILAACKREKEQLLTSHIEYDIELGQYLASSWPLADQQRFVMTLLDAVDQGRAKDENGFPVTWNTIAGHLKKTGLSDSFSFDSIKYYLLHRVNFIRFKEKWFYDKNNYHLYKTVEAIAPGCKISIEGDSLHAGYDKWIPLFWVDISRNFQKTDMSMDYVITHVFIRNDVEDVLDRYDSIYPSLCNLPRLSRDSFYVRLIRAYESKKIPVYNMFFQPFTMADYARYFELKKLLESDNLLQNYFHPSYFARIKFIEKWNISFDPLAIQKKIIAYSPSQVVFDTEYNMVKGYRLLFWVVQDSSCLKDASEHGYWME